MKLKQFTAITKALSDPQRIRAFMALRKGELCLCQIIELLNLAPSTISKHMSILKQAGLIDSRKDSRWVYYRLSTDHSNDKETLQIIKLALSILIDDKTIAKDDECMKNILKVTIETICKRKSKD